MLRFMFQFYRFVLNSIVNRDVRYKRSGSFDGFFFITAAIISSYKTFSALDSIVFTKLPEPEGMKLFLILIFRLTLCYVSIYSW